MLIRFIVRSNLSDYVLQGATAELLLYLSCLASATSTAAPTHHRLLLHASDVAAAAAAAATPYPALPKHLHAA